MSDMSCLQFFSYPWVIRFFFYFISSDTQSSIFACLPFFFRSCTSLSLDQHYFIILWFYFILSCRHYSIIPSCLFEYSMGSWVSHVLLYLFHLFYFIYLRAACAVYDCDMCGCVYVANVLPKQASKQAKWCRYVIYRCFFVCIQKRKYSVLTPPN